jgi:hypothetical protein
MWYKFLFSISAQYAFLHFSQRIRTFQFITARFVQLPSPPEPFFSLKSLSRISSRAQKLQQAKGGFLLLSKIVFLFHFLTGASSGPCDLDEILGRAPFGSDFMLDFAFIFIRNKSNCACALTLYKNCSLATGAARAQKHPCCARREINKCD